MPKMNICTCADWEYHEEWCGIWEPEEIKPGELGSLSWAMTSVLCFIIFMGVMLAHA